MFGDQALALIVESKRSSQTDTLYKYNDQLVRNVQLEIRTLQSDLQKTVGPDINALTPSQQVLCASTMYHIAIRRNKRCLLAYHAHRLERLKHLYWSVGGALPHILTDPEIRSKLSPHEVDFLRSYNASVSDIRNEVLDVLDLAQGISVPPKDMRVNVVVSHPKKEVELLASQRSAITTSDELHDPSIPDSKVKYAPQAAAHILSRKAQPSDQGLPDANRGPPPTMPRKSGPITKRPIPHVKHVVAVASGKGGVGKSTVAANLAVALARQSFEGRNPRVGLLDLDIFGPSVPKLMGLEGLPPPELTKGLHQTIFTPTCPNLSLTQCMSIGFMVPQTDDTAVVWRGLMVQKAAQQLLFDVDWRGHGGEGHPGLDVLVIDMPPGTGDVQLTLGQLVQVDGAVVVSTPQDVALIDAKKGVAMFRKVDVPIIGLLLNMAHFTCSTCSTPHHIFGPLTSFHQTADALNLKILGELPITPSVSADGDSGSPTTLRSGVSGNIQGVDEVQSVMDRVAKNVLATLSAKDSGGRG
ncbi:hypothetical protein FS837_001835 [Tulasnella sp. UAMH 9824]|nr:hypothetical protein FS837_001835 [Tulasnella sp. UAMH 9824]